MPGYLLDNNHVQGFFNKLPQVITRASAVKNSQLVTSAIILGEIEAGHWMTDGPHIIQEKRNEYRAWVDSTFLPSVLNVSITTRIYYAQIMGRLWEKHRPASKRTKTERHLVEKFGIDINDVWHAAVAWEHGLTLVTHDGMEKIRDVLLELKRDGVELLIEDWMELPTSRPIASPPPS